MRLPSVVVVVTALLAGVQSASAQFAGWNVTGTVSGVFGKLTQETAFVPPPPPSPCNNCEGDGSASLRGLMGGLGLGYNWQAGSWVYGLATDFSLGNADGSTNDCGTPAHECGGALRSLGTVRGLVGWSMGTWMPYATGGYAYGDVRAYDAFFGGSGSKYRGGWTVGGGIEMMLSGAWSAKLDYLYVDLGKDHLYDLLPGVPEYVQTTANVVRFGLTYRFVDNQPSAPMVTKAYRK